MDLVTPVMRAELDERGFVFTDVVFDSATIASLRAECRRVWEVSTALDPRSGAPLEPSDIRRLRPFLPRMFEQSAVVADFAHHEVFRSLGRSLVGPDVDLSWSQNCWKAPDTDEVTRFPFHQDGYFADVTNRDFGYACFIALVPLDVTNGTLHFAARAHKSTLAHVRNDRHQWFECSVDGFEVVPGVLAPGQMIVYRNMTPHGSPPNESALPREAMLMSFGPPGTALVETGELFGDCYPILRGGEPVERTDAVLEVASVAVR